MDKMPLLKVLLRSNGIQSSDELATLLVEQSILCQNLLSTPKKLDMRRLLEVIFQMRQVKNEAAAAAADPESYQADCNSKKILQELIEQSEQNYSNLCKMGGMPILLMLIVTHDSEPVRAATCRTFTTMNSNKLHPK